MSSVARFEQHLTGSVLAEGHWRAMTAQLVRRPRRQHAIALPAVVEAQLVVIVRGCALVEERAATSDWHGVEVAAGDFFLSHSPTPYELRWQARGPEPFEVLMLYLDIERVAAALDVAPALHDVSGVRDPVVATLAELVVAELLRETRSALAIDGIATTLAAHLLRSHGGGTTGRSRTARLPAHKLRRAVAWLDARLDRDLDLVALARHLRLSPSHVSRAFRGSTGLAPSRYFVRLRMDRARILLRETSQSILEIALAVGYASHSHFTQAFRRTLGVTPTDYRLWAEVRGPEDASSSRAGPIG